VGNLKDFAAIQANLRRIAAEATRLAEKAENIKKELKTVALRRGSRK
jgi:hypothetical protein